MTNTRTALWDVVLPMLVVIGIVWWLHERGWR